MFLIEQLSLPKGQVKLPEAVKLLRSEVSASPKWRPERSEEVLLGCKLNFTLYAVQNFTVACYNFTLTERLKLHCFLYM